MSYRSAFVYDQILSQHVLSPKHPLKPIRLQYTYDLLNSYGIFDDSRISVVKPRLAKYEEVLSFHSSRYVDAVSRVSEGKETADLGSFGFGTADNPVYSNMYESALWSSGASMLSAELLLSDTYDSVMNISGGLHHAMPQYASGFCIFNDPVMAIKRFLSDSMKVAYVDIDCHHGDGVQHAFYDTDSVLTISIHESGNYIFPGTGAVEEFGSGKGRGYSINLPLYPYTTDDIYLWAFKQVVPTVLEKFKPDILVTQLGIDSHFRDPITHLALTVQGFRDVVKEFSKVSAKWMGLGGGGYDLQAVARGWASAYGVMCEYELQDQIPLSYGGVHEVYALSDDDSFTFGYEIHEKARKFAEGSVAEIRKHIFPFHGLGHLE